MNKQAIIKKVISKLLAPDYHKILERQRKTEDLKAAIKDPETGKIYWVNEPIDIKMVASISRQSNGITEDILDAIKEKNIKIRYNKADGCGEELIWDSSRRGTFKGKLKKLMKHEAGN